MNEEQSVHVVAQLYRWEKTRVALSIWDRLMCLVKGQLDLGSLVDDSIGWVPVFNGIGSARAYCDKMGISHTQIVEAKSRLDE